MNTGTLHRLGLAGWTPIRLFWSNGEPQVDWCRFPAGSFSDPFFEQTLGNAMANPARMLFRRRTPADVLEAIGRERAGCRPCGMGGPPVETERIHMDERVHAASEGGQEVEPAVPGGLDCEPATRKPAGTADSTSASLPPENSRHGQRAYAATTDHGRDARATVDHAQDAQATSGASGHAVELAGFIFHGSRCGSTLLAQMLSALPGNIVLSEPPLVNEILMAHCRDARITREQRIAWLRGAVSALSQPRTGSERRLFIKFDCFHVFERPLIAEAFPGIPWAFVYRDPVEVLVSHQRDRAAQLIPGLLDPRPFGIGLDELPRISADEYAARVLAVVYSAAGDRVSDVGLPLVVTPPGLDRAPHAQPALRSDGAGGAATSAGPAHAGARLVNFTELPAALWDERGLWSIEWTADEIVTMQQAARFNAKRPLQPYSDDRVAKQTAASAELRAAAAWWLAEPYARLEAMRLRWGVAGRRPRASASNAPTQADASVSHTDARLTGVAGRRPPRLVGGEPGPKSPTPAPTLYATAPAALPATTTIQN